MSQFCETSVTTTVFGMLDAARFKMKCGVLIGPSGVGKTFACTHYVAQNRGDAWILTATSASGNAAQNLFRKFCRLVSDDYDSEFRIAESGSIAEIQDRLRAYNFAGRLLVIDEAQNLSAQGIRELLTLNDSSDLSVIFCGNEEVLKGKNIEEGPLAVIGSRLFFRKTLALITTDDADALAAAFGTIEPDAMALARTIGTQRQARGLTFVLDVARTIAGPDKPITLAHLKDVLTEFPHYRPVKRRAAS